MVHTHQVTLGASPDPCELAALCFRRFGKIERQTSNLKGCMHTDRPTPELSPREEQLLKYAAEGMTDTAIANKLGISEATVGTYWGRVRIKLGPYSRTELVAIMLRAERESAVEALRRENDHLVQQLRAQSGTLGAAFYRDLLEQAPDAMLVVTEDGKIEYANEAANELFGYSKDGLSGKDLLSLIPQRFRDRHVEHREAYVQDPARRQMGEHLETPAIKKDGTEFPIRASLSAIQTPDGLTVMCVVRSLEQG